MKTNVGKNERALRFVLGAILIAVVYIMPFYGFVTYVLYVISGILILTGIIGFCPLYSIFHYSSKGHGIDHITKKDIQDAVREKKVYHNIKKTHKIKEVEISDLKKKTKKTTSISKKKQIKNKKKTTSSNKKTNSKSKKNVKTKKLTKK